MTDSPRLSFHERIDLACRLEDCARNWRADAAYYTGRRRAWRIARADALMARAWSLIGVTA